MKENKRKQEGKSKKRRGKEKNWGEKYRCVCRIQPRLFSFVASQHDHLAIQAIAIECYFQISSDDIDSTAT